MEDVKDTIGLWIKYYSVSGERFRTKSYSRWNSMRLRCATGGKYQKKFQTYTGCTLSDNFKDFQFFTEWHRWQVGYNLDGYNLDKDILFSGNKTYGEDVCVLVPSALNSFLTARDYLRGNYPQGVSFHKATQKFIAQISINGKRTHLGLYSTPDEAAEAYKAAKEAEARRWCERLKAGEFIVDPRVIERMRTWTFEEGEE